MPYICIMCEGISEEINLTEGTFPIVGGEKRFERLRTKKSRKGAAGDLCRVTKVD